MSEEDALGRRIDELLENSRNLREIIEKRMDEIRDYWFGERITEMSEEKAPDRVTLTWEETMAEEKTYKIPLRCTNCGFVHGQDNIDWEIAIPKGVSMNGYFGSTAGNDIKCPYCGCGVEGAPLISCGGNHYFARMN